MVSIYNGRFEDAGNISLNPKPRAPVLGLCSGRELRLRVQCEWPRLHRGTQRFRV